MRRAWLCLSLAACNPLFGLQETILIDASLVDDRDGDGVLDSVDNCPDVANAAQRDLDTDVIGDDCDPCSFEFTATLDRDMDSVAPADDNCAGVGNATQADADADGVGDDCDPNPTAPDKLRCFGDLVTNAALAWPIADPWKTLGTSTGYIVHQPAIETPFWLGAHASGLRASQLAVQIGLVAPGTPTTDVMLATGVAVGAADQTAYGACELVAVMSDSSPRLQVSDSTGPLGVTSAPVTPEQLTLTYRMTAAGVELQCTAHGRLGGRETLTRTSTASFDPAVVYLTATNSTTAFRSISVYETE